MRKSIALICVLTILITLTTSNNLKAEEITDITIYVDNEKIELDTKPIIRDNRTLVPIRGVLEKLGAEVDWNKETKQVIVKDDQMEILLETGNTAVLVDGKINFLDTKSLVIDNRTLVPLRFIAETLGFDVTWNGQTHRIDIESNDVVGTEPNELPTVDSADALAQLLKYSNQLNKYIDYRMVDVMDGGTIKRDLESMQDTAEDVAMPVSEEAAAESAKESSDYSNTNNQTEGVIEGDITKTNGEYIFYTKNNQVIILDSNPLKPEILSTIPVKTDKGYIREIYLQDKQLVIIGTSYTTYGYPEPLVDNMKMSFAPYYYTNNTFVQVYDFTEVSKPIKVMDMDFEGSYVSSRLIEDKFYMVTDKNLNYYDVERVLLLNEEKDTTAQALFDYELKPKYANNLTNETFTIDFKDIYYFPDYIKPNYLLTIGIDLTTKESEVVSYLGSAENVYASQENLYLTFTDYDYTNEGEGLIYVPNYQINTSIYKFDLDMGQIVFNSKGKVSGTVVNQFSLDEYNGYLRIATTTGEMWNQDNPSINNVFVLDDELNQVGELTGLAPGEKIYSTRFAGERIYMVTYRQVDPFFVIDVKDPTKPVVLGELKIPGFSSYMHILDSNHVLGFGTETTEVDGLVLQGGFKISLFDVTDPENPVEKKKEVIGTSGTYSELSYNHKALMISLSKGIMGLPITVASKTPYSQDFDGAYVYDITTDDFSFKGLISHKVSDKPELYYGYGIHRLLYIGDYIYTLSDNKMKVTDMGTMKMVSEVELPTTGDGVRMNSSDSVEVAPIE